MDDESESEKDYPLTPAKPSKTPSWIMLGFVLGALFMWMLPRDSEPSAAPELKPRAAPTEPPRTMVTTITTIEAVFEIWGKHAVWDNDTTEVALDSGAGSFSECYEVRRAGEELYYRSIPKLTRREIRHGKPLPSGCPLLFTETEQQYREWLEHGRTERPAETPKADRVTEGTGGPGKIGAGLTVPAPSASKSQVRDLPVTVPRVAPPLLPTPSLAPGEGKILNPAPEKKD